MLAAMKAPPSRRTVLVARSVAIAADALQIALLPVFAPGILSPVSNTLDVAVALFMFWTLGWHVAFLPTLVTEMIPFAGVFPTWTLAVLFVTRRFAPPR
jgi:hypothetical protein